MDLWKSLVILMAPFFGAGGPMHLCLHRSCRPGLHGSSGLQRTQAIRMTMDGSATLIRLPRRSHSCAVFFSPFLFFRSRCLW